tara:strand:+ start:1250 stop:1531 length:282 start_codon:yes stop_codon:yes gene_type:complete
LSKIEIIKKLKEKNPNLDTKILEEIFDCFFDNIKQALTKDRPVEIRSFGTFFLKKIKEKRNAIDPRSGKIIYVPEKKKLRFRASKRLKELINK